MPTPGDLGMGDDAMAEAMTPLLELLWKAEIAEFAAKVGLDPEEWAVTNAKIADAIKEQAIELCKETQATTSKALDDALADLKADISAGLFEGDSTVELVARIKAIFDGAATWRARMIATTEASRAVHEAEMLLGEESGVVKGWRWLLSSDACPMCQTIARRCPVVRDGTPFAIIGESAVYSTIKHPPAHPACQCTLVPVLDIDDEPIEWGTTLVQPKPEGQDYPPGEAPESVAA